MNLSPSYQIQLRGAKPSVGNENAFSEAPVPQGSDQAIFFLFYLCNKNCTESLDGVYIIISSFLAFFFSLFTFLSQ